MSNPKKKQELEGKMELSLGLIPGLLGIKYEIDPFLRLRATREKDELESDAWKSLEKVYFEHLKWRFEYPKKVFGQQRFSGWLITCLVVLLIIAGLTFSFLQLQSAIKLGDFSNLNSDVTIETAGKVSINSSIVGAVVLVISLAFFYLYLRYVFKIQYPTPPHISFTETDIMSLLKDSDIEKTDEKPDQNKK
ncbi:MAG: hypothetical protein GWN01_04915 [Nitrosopumilaceae archaeon]|nr:hypothetical protein [Nitrosopumilaceae archaeon]NIV65391.1 hypothetical protein [Nitrosopumilaceae archaeon]NIX60886.1 hypothetical protein [Nitrosopumilaceae archaeon]